jgi:hypothetical protein
VQQLNQELLTFPHHLGSPSVFNQELLTFPHHLGSSSVFIGVGVVRSLVFYVMFCSSLFVLFRLTIVLSVLLPFTASDYNFGFFKLYF